ncbi:hypothetical protein COLO4_36384 [Corchorus olitorius]|uniref:Uncharacterized protein n=1 Tax=Corchorus olitorius TaxID=93759 RepID=A0A1R3G946_9ROSI|nr:hypothetical protein COLO4_36384 [Corchorus olitorius]
MATPPYRPLNLPSTELKSSRSHHRDLFFPFPSFLSSNIASNLANGAKPEPQTPSPIFLFHHWILPISQCVNLLAFYSKSPFLTDPNTSKSRRLRSRLC